MALLEEDKLREIKKAERELTQQNADLTTKLSMAQVRSTFDHSSLIILAIAVVGGI